MPEVSSPIATRRRAVLIFADAMATDLSRRGFPQVAGTLLRGPLPNLENSLGYDVHLFSRALSREKGGARSHLQRGATFAARLENAIETLTSLGYAEIVAIGRDCPSLRLQDIALAFDHLTRSKLVLGPDHRGGCYLIGFRATDRSLVRGIRWNRNTDCAQLRNRAGEIALSVLEVKQDVDTWNDLRLLSQTADPCGKLASFILRQAGGTFRSNLIRFVNDSWRAQLARRQLPPPLAA